LTVILGLLTKPGDVVATACLTYPGLRSLAAHMGLTLVGVPFDEKGFSLEAMEEQFRRQPPEVLYCNPVMHNPTTTTLDEERRSIIVEIARKYGVTIIEDDAYWALADKPCTPLAELAPDITWHIAGLAKALSPALRISYGGSGWTGCPSGLCGIACNGGHGLTAYRCGCSQLDRNRRG
jgi:DNA-binding transcriptional MocR family regulator